MYISRHIEQTVLSLSSSYPVVMVCGQRQIGKSTMLYHLKGDDRRYVTLDDMNARRLAETDPELFFENYGYTICIDEFQRVPQLLIEIKRIVDKLTLEGSDANGLFWLTGSQKFQMMKEVSESLAGRIAVVDMAGLSRSEICGEPYLPFDPDINALKQRRIPAPDMKKVYEQIFKGSMPKLYASDIDRERYYMDYVNTYLERDIKQLSQVGKLEAFYDFLVCMAARTAQELKYADIAGLVGVSAPTIREWVSILERSGVIYILHPYHNNISKRMVKTPKVYFVDTGLAAYLCRWSDAETLQNGASGGAFLETYVVSELLKNCYNAGKQPELYYYRDVDRREIDLLYLSGRKLYPIEIKRNKLPDHPDRHFGALDRLDLDVQTGLAICFCNELTAYSRNCYLCPVTAI